jgi:ABC-type multidrug transport system permease subunit
MSTAAIAVGADPLGLAGQIRLLFGRFFRVTMRNPVLPVANLLTSAFFLIAYDGGLGGSDGINALTGGNYVNFILPVGVLFAGLAGSVSGSLMLQDISSGYLQRQLSMPLSRFAIVLAPMLIGAAFVLSQSLLIIVFAIIFMGADPATGAAGLLVVLALALLWGMGFAGFSVAIGLRTGNAYAAQAASLLTFPLLFLSPLFLPKDQLKDWMQTVASVNPTTYVLDAMRSLFSNGWQTDKLLEGFAAAAIFFAIAMTLAAIVARQETRRH